MNIARKWTIASLLSVAFCFAAYAYLTWVPARQLQLAGTWTQSEHDRTEKIPEDAIITRMIGRARRDFFLSPRHWFGHGLNFVEARSVPPNDVYLLFYSSSDVHTIIVYRATRESGRLLWKADWAQ